MFDYFLGHIKCRVYTIEAFGIGIQLEILFNESYLILTYLTPKCCYINNFLEVYQLNL